MNKKIEKFRLDHLLVQRGLVENSSKARARIMAGDVIVDDHRADKAGERFPATVEIRLRNNSQPFVSRGGLKLEHALTTWPIDLTDAICIDVGASTGGFTEVLLLHGARLVYAVDVGYGQLAEKLRIDPRVNNLERTHILNLKRESLPLVPNVAVIDVSFISLEKILAHVASLLGDNGIIYALIKPQFESGRQFVEKGGIVKDPLVHQTVIEKIQHHAEEIDLVVLGVVQSPIHGAKGNVEFLIAMKKHR